MRRFCVYKILVIEDDEMLNAGICFHLQKRAMEAESAYDLKAAKELMKTYKPDLILLDVNLPDGNGFQFAKHELQRSNIPFIFLTAHNLDDEMIDGFRLGADDYITKPFNIKLAIERIDAVLRRCGDIKTDTYKCGNLTIDFTNRTISKNGLPLSLTPTEFSLLQCFCDRKNQVLTKGVLLENVWDSKGNFVDEHTLTINISRLRNKIEDETFKYIKTIYGMGYQWIGEGNA